MVNLRASSRNSPNNHRFGPPRASDDPSIGRTPEKNPPRTPPATALMLTAATSILSPFAPSSKPQCMTASYGMRPERLAASRKCWVGHKAPVSFTGNTSERKQTRSRALT